MKVMILAGGYGTRISDENTLKPKLLIEIGGIPILVHIMKIYSSFGFNDFIIACGYKGYLIKEYFADYWLHNSDITFDFTDGNEIIIHNSRSEKWRITCIDTGVDTLTGGRVKKLRPYVGDKDFMLTYGDGVSDVNITNLCNFHRSHGKIATVTATSPLQRFGALELDGDNIASFSEKPNEMKFINCGFMVLSPQIFEYMTVDDFSFEQEILPVVAQAGQAMAFKHEGFWQCMDTPRDKNLLEEMWNSGNPPWKVW